MLEGGIENITDGHETIQMNKNTYVYIFIGNILKKRLVYTMETKGNGSTNRT